MKTSLEKALQNNHEYGKNALLNAMLKKISKDYKERTSNDRCFSYKLNDSLTSMDLSWSEQLEQITQCIKEFYSNYTDFTCNIDYNTFEVSITLG